MKKLFLVLPFFMVSCSTSTGNSDKYLTYLPSATNGYKGLMAAELSSPPLSFMAGRCENFGGLDYSSVQDEPVPSWKVIGYFYKSYKCYGPEPKLSSVPITIQEPKAHSRVPVTFNDAKDKCSDLGFKPQTEAFGNCVLKLSQ